MRYRKGNINDVDQMRTLALKAWHTFQNDLTAENWQKLWSALDNKKTYLNLVEQSTSIVCENEDQEVIGMAFLVPSGNPTEIYQEDWSYIRFVSVDPKFSGKNIGRQLTIECIAIAKHNKESTVALHTSEIMNKARHIYESLGFSIHREIEPRFGKRYWLYTLKMGSQ